jgi:hypothetical protein
MRTWKPKVGQKVKLCRLELYSQLEKLDKHGWTWFTVDLVFESATRVVLASEDGSTHEAVPLEWIEKPLGWEPVYMITCKSEELARKVIDVWFHRGIHVWQSQDLSCAGRQAFTPFSLEGDCCSPHYWQYGREPLEAIEPAECKNVFKVVWLDEQEEHYLPTDRAERRKAIAGRKQDHPERTYEYDKRSQRWVSWCEIVLYAPEEG